MAWLLEQIKNEEVFSILAAKYNKFVQQQHSGESKELEIKTQQLMQVEKAISNIITSIEQGVVSPTLTNRLHELEDQKQKLDGQIKYLEGLNKTQVLMTPLAIKRRFDEIPKLLREKSPAEVNRVLKSLFKGTSQIVLVPKVESGKEDYWAVGTLNIGRLMNIASKLTGEYSESEVVVAEIPFDFKIGADEIGN